MGILPLFLLFTSLNDTIWNENPYFYPFLREEKIQWSDTEYEDDRRLISFKLPGAIIKNTKEPKLYMVQSTCQNSQYTFYFNPSYTFIPPENIETFIEEFKFLQNLENPPEITILETAQNCLYTFQLQFLNPANENETFCRIFVTHNSLYMAIVEGKDKKTRKAFFNAIHFLKK